MEQVHKLWLAAGAQGDVETMKRLRVQHPQWLDLNRVRAMSDSDTPTHTRFCSWDYFHLPTIGASALLTAAWDGCVEIVELLLEAGQDPDTKDEGGLTSMMVAILRYNVVAMRCVFRNSEAIRRSLVVDCREEDQELLEHVHAIVSLLQQFGGDVNAQNQEGYAALHYAGNGDALDIATMLLNNGADIDAQDQHGKTPLHHCIREGSLLVANLLVSRGALIDCEDTTGETPLTLALQQHRGNMLQIILNHHHLVVTAKRKDFATSVLLSAVENEVEDAVRLIIEGGYSTGGISNDNGETPLHLAILKRNSQLMETLINLDPTGSILTAVTLTGDTPAHYTARYGSVDEVETLLRHLSTVFGDFQVMDEPTNPFNVRNNDNSTCLFLAGTRANAGHREERDAIVLVLLHHGARLFVSNSIFIMSEPNEQVLLDEQVGRGLVLWAQEASDRDLEILDGDDGDDQFESRISDVLLTDVGVEWVAGLGENLSTDFTAMLHVAVSAGYALEFLPLLLVLPLQRYAIPALFRRLERFARFPRPHRMLLRLHVELSEALSET
ncbi:hypothetical protein PHMEG_00010796 [Phytophthora megakarya]|uniref:Uncharacterized protein n=1 Tax=Phytophthora megakarya TaxID=4795 RepID=A0A225WCU6_9STRA|nr:hypothetical protein PHMEG_00010796 [Phytophthora megakarya]